MERSALRESDLVVAERKRWAIIVDIFLGLDCVMMMRIEVIAYFCTNSHVGVHIGILHT